VATPGGATGVAKAVRRPLQGRGCGGAPEVCGRNVGDVPRALGRVPKVAMGEPAAEAVRGHEEGVYLLLEPRGEGGKPLVTPYGAANFAPGGHGKLTMLA